MDDFVRIIMLFGFVALLMAIGPLWRAAKRRWPDWFETEKFTSDEIPESWMAVFLLWVIGTVLATFEWGAGGFMLTFIVGFVFMAALIHVPRYARHQWRRRRRKNQTLEERLKLNLKR